MNKIEMIADKLVEKTKVPYYKLKLSEMENESLIESKIAGIPYLESLKDVPKSKIVGRDLRLLAQINFEEMPENGIYPKKGILQFWLSQDSDSYGLVFSEDQNIQSDWRVIFYPEISSKLSLEETSNNLRIVEDIDFPVKGVYKVDFEKAEMPITPDILNFDETLEEIINEAGIEIDYRESWKVNEKLHEEYNFFQSSMGGYPAFTQADPRIDYSSLKEYDTLLLQIDSEQGIMWGDTGIANFFIKSEDLKKGDFTDILYNWDCC